ncbi:short chain aldehyde dehydrogenase 1-like [Prosopis cineraria]|uniref:short chain aldehyde dehydrogenase 1-like n=1 Tax=Prosopis cineraria TaxID=364024 RepID=UPI00240F12C4|nr:short chain aldehyde dehydrogenase 1-like [Prosopis cineraria]
MDKQSSSMATISKRLQGKVAIITGGASGIGAATTKLFVQNGAKVIVADIQDDRGLSLCNALGANDTVSYVHCDVTSDSDIKNAVDTAVTKYGKLDIMYNNAGILGDFDFTIQGSSNETFKRVFEVNVYGAFLGAKHAARVMMPAKAGVILFTASLASVVAGEAPHAYAASKHAIVGLMKNLSAELGQYGIRVNCISPGAVLTPLASNTLKIDSRVTEKMMGMVMSKGMVLMEPEEVGNAALYLSCDDSKSVNGLNLVVEGGANNGKANLSLASGVKDLMKLFYKK